MPRTAWFSIQVTVTEEMMRNPMLLARVFDHLFRLPLYSHYANSNDIRIINLRAYCKSAIRDLQAHDSVKDPAPRKMS